MEEQSKEAIGVKEGKGEEEEKRETQGGGKKEKSKPKKTREYLCCLQSLGSTSPNSPGLPQGRQWWQKDWTDKLPFWAPNDLSVCCRAVPTSIALRDPHEGDRVAYLRNPVTALRYAHSTGLS